MSEPTDPLAELRRIVEAATPGNWSLEIPDRGYRMDYIVTVHPPLQPVEGSGNLWPHYVAETDCGNNNDDTTLIVTAARAIRYLTSPEAEVEIARVLLKPQSHAAQARAVLRFIAEKAVTR